jgi:hypothetical protein
MTLRYLIISLQRMASFSDQHSFCHTPDSSLAYIVTTDFESDNQFSLLQFPGPLCREIDEGCLILRSNYLAQSKLQGVAALRLVVPMRKMHLGKNITFVDIYPYRREWKRTRGMRG